jgi:hypothetical protein
MNHAPNQPEIYDLIGQRLLLYDSGPATGSRPVCGLLNQLKRKVRKKTAIG